jgi:hypothetical protein
MVNVLGDATLKMAEAVAICLFLINTAKRKTSSH